MGRWLEHSVTTEIEAPVERVWEVWSDLEAMPRWMRWIESVVTLCSSQRPMVVPQETPTVAGEPVAALVAKAAG